MRRPPGLYPKPARERFWDKVSKSDGCWEWMGYLNPKGYGVLAGDRKGRNAPKKMYYLAHRLSWEIANGAIPDGKCICHHCDNRKCVRPEHLFLGTRADNTLDMIAKGRHRQGKHKLRTHCRRGHNMTPENVYDYGPRTRRCRQCSLDWRRAPR